MNKDQKLVEDIATLLRGAGYVGVTVQRDDAGTTLSGTRDGGAAMLRLATHLVKGAKRSEIGGPEQHAERFDAQVVPNAEGLVEQLRAQPELAEVFRVPAAHLKHVM